LALNQISKVYSETTGHQSLQMEFVDDASIFHP